MGFCWPEFWTEPRKQRFQTFHPPGFPTSLSHSKSKENAKMGCMMVCGWSKRTCQKPPCWGRNPDTLLSDGFGCQNIHIPNQLGSIDHANPITLYPIFGLCVSLCELIAGSLLVTTLATAHCSTLLFPKQSSFIILVIKIVKNQSMSVRQGGIILC